MTLVCAVIDALGEGGTERSLTELLPGLTASGFETAVVCLGSRGTEGYEDEVRASGVPVQVVGPGNLASQVARARRLFLAIDPALVHTMLFRATLVGRLASVGLRAPLVTSLVNTSYATARFADPGFSSGKLHAVRVVDAVTARLRTTHFHAVSQAAADDAVSHLGVRREQITVIHRGRSDARLGPMSEARRSSARRVFGVDDGALHIVAIGRQEHQKGLDVLVRALLLARQDRDDLVLTVAGRQGTATPLLTSLAGPLGGSARFLGHVADIGELLASGDLFVFPSRYEGLPGALIEAMMMGLPIIASDIPPVLEVVERDGNALLVSANDRTRLAQAMVELAGDEGRRIAMGRRSRELYAERFTLERSVAAMADLYRQVLAGSSR